ncbi:MAG: hypothetical protein IM638_19905 [Bacteroidetes bacterium]|nr:hypothetical protein [Bacteroidota bacterium]
MALPARYPGLRNALPAVEARIGGQAYNTVETSLLIEAFPKNRYAQNYLLSQSIY